MADDMKRRGLLSRRDAIRSSGMSESGFNRLNLTPAERVGRQTFYRVRDIVAAVLRREALRSPVLESLAKVSPRAAEAAAAALADEALR